MPMLKRTADGFPHRRAAHAGFTLVELLVALAVLAILVSIGIPSFQNLIAENRVSSAANNLQLALQLARSTAASRNYEDGDSVTVCASSDGVQCSGEWNDGWIVLDPNASDDTVLRSFGPLHASISFSTTPDNIDRFDFTNVGTVDQPGTIAFDIPDQSGRSISILRSGSTSVTRLSSD